MLNKLSPNDRAAVSVFALLVFLGVIGIAAIIADKALDTYRAIEVARASAKAAPIEVRGAIAPEAFAPPSACWRETPDGGIDWPARLLDAGVIVGGTREPR